MCKNFRTANRAGGQGRRRMTPSEYCLTCHRKIRSEPRTHRAHAEAGVGCLRCHPPMRTRDGMAYSIHDHKFLFLKPEDPPVAGPREACALCHPGEQTGKRAADLARSGAGSIQ